MLYYVGKIVCMPSDIRHFGIKGMRWGVRRWQNDDGTLTDAGKARYAERTGKRDARDMSDRELQNAVQRLRNEREYNNLIKELYPSKIKKGAKAVGKILSIVGNKVIVPAIESAAKAAGKALVEAAKENYDEDKRNNRSRTSGDENAR